jgi:hypothetical protein
MSFCDCVDEKRSFAEIPGFSVIECPSHSMRAECGEAVARPQLARVGARSSFVGAIVGFTVANPLARVTSMHAVIAESVR